ncbi:hypothetical protein C8R48DRAFT_677363 [Suillus tomentosus]|nr:hypothetical protein C8R48DRAFT_677363 [Suillus tomentosus]
MAIIIAACTLIIILASVWITVAITAWTAWTLAIRKYVARVICAFSIREMEKVWRSKEIGSLGPTLIRSPFANGVTFLGFELASIHDHRGFTSRTSMPRRSV